MEGAGGLVLSRAQKIRRDKRQSINFVTVFWMEVFLYAVESVTCFSPSAFFLFVYPFDYSNYFPLPESNQFIDMSLCCSTYERTFFSRSRRIVSPFID